jgi:hypothetical protein
MWYHHDVIAASKPKSEGRGSTGARALAEEEWAISMNNKSRKKESLNLSVLLLLIYAQYKHVRAAEFTTLNIFTA